MTRTGKIARLPEVIRQQLNQQIADGVPGVKLVEWLNSLREVRKALKENFDGREINEVNLSEWKGGGFVEWQMQRGLMESAKAMVEDGTNMKAELDGVLTEHLSLAMAARYAQLLRGWNGEVDEEFMKKLKALKMLCKDVGSLRRGDQREEGLELRRNRYADTKRSEEEKAFDCLYEDSREYPEVVAAFRRVFELRRAYEKGEKQNRD